LYHLTAEVNQGRFWHQVPIKGYRKFYIVTKSTIELAPEILKKMGQKGREIVEGKYEISKIISQHMRIIEEV